MSYIGGLFGRSPLGPLHEHALKVKSCLKSMEPLFDNFISGDRDEALNIIADIHQNENEADQIKSEIRQNLSKSIFNAVQREDLMLFLKVHDDVADTCEQIAKLIEIRETKFPDDLKDLFNELLASVLQCSLRVINMTETFSKSDSKTATSHKEYLINEINTMHNNENLIDGNCNKLLKALFKLENKLDSITVIFLMEIIENVTYIAKRSINAADSFRRIVQID